MNFQDSDGYETESTTLWNDRVASQETEFGSIDEFLNDDVWMYHSSLGIKFRGRICSGSTYSCQAVANPCLQANAVTTIDKRKDTVSVKVSDEILYASNISQLLYGSRSDDENDDITSSGRLIKAICNTYKVQSTESTLYWC